jgi:hemoglobin
MDLARSPPALSLLPENPSDDLAGVDVMKSGDSPGDALTTTASEVRIRELINLFYARVRHDPLLAPVFKAAIGSSMPAWTAHLARLTDFWSSVMQGSGRYQGDPFSVHLRLAGLTPLMFDRWLALFQTTCRDVLLPEEAAAFCKRAERIARSLRMGLFERLPARMQSYQPQSPAEGRT